MSEHRHADALALALFTAKEAAFKAWYPATGSWMGMLSVDVVLRDHSFSVEAVRGGPKVHGRWEVREGMVLAVAGLR